MGTSMNDYVASYRLQLGQGDIQIAYKFLLRFMGELKACFAREASGVYNLGNISPGYMDYTYFPFSNNLLRSRKLRFGLVLNHQDMRFELWLMGQNAEVQKEYWNLLKATDWNKGRTDMPQYSVLEAVLVDTPDFNEPDTLIAQIMEETRGLAEKILSSIPGQVS